ncbi:DUF488 family protein [Natranaerobius thermophilus]|uniref:DUF488 domain-containing protein n=1 Tax=Natranaerobius thermophilus (strain ATCC BAA-1301 / DSM 18059 / JW/NM-WN-LF) TaxID=457570 RepID=B2A6U0_NATTJ|nr:DUF488 domain-containing protein [Natranaerobius thermophilus]ACB84221.1 protein of unknown function DUF1130 [Natranaerobius thermophilus JW/NM-WN-LF]
MYETNMYKSKCFTIGHSNNNFNTFLKLLSLYNIKAVADIRRIPYSSHVPHFSKKNFEKKLAENNIKYCYLGKYLGGFQEIPQNELQIGLKKFQQILNCANRLTGEVTIMCSERDPSKCHRSSLISPLLIKEEITVYHILSSNKLISHQELEQILIDKYIPNYNQISLLDSHPNYQNILTQAYQKRRQDKSRLFS